VNKERFKQKIKDHYLYKRTLENKRFLLLLLILIILISYNYYSKGFIYDLAHNNLDDTINFIQSFGNLSWLIYVLIIIIETVLAPLPAIVIYSAGSIAFGPIMGGILTLFGNIIGASIGYIIAKRYGGFYFEKLIGEKKLSQFHRYSERYGGFVLFILRLNPITSSDIFNYIAGFIEISYKKFILATALGLMPTIFIISYFGEIFIKENPFLKLFFLIISFVYITLFIYGHYKIGKEKFNERFKKDE